MDTFLVNNRPMSPKDWGIDTAVTALAFLFGCVQLMLTASSIVIPDLALRQYLGSVNVVPNVQVFVALAVTTLPLIVRRRFPWPVFLFCLVSFLGLQNAFSGFSLTIVGPVVALYTIASERGRGEAIAGVVIAVAGLLFYDSHAGTASLVLFTRFQNIAMVVAAALAGTLFACTIALVAAAAMPPAALTAITDPGARGEDPQVFVTWASATSLPVSNQRATSSLISRMVLSPWNRIGTARPRAARGTGAAARSYAVWQVAHSSFDRFWPVWLEGCCAPVLEPLWQLRQSEPLLPCPMAGGSPTMP